MDRTLFHDLSGDELFSQMSSAIRHNLSLAPDDYRRLVEWPSPGA